MSEAYICPYCNKIIKIKDKIRLGNQAHVMCPECEGIILKPGCEFKEMLKVKDEPEKFLPPGPWTREWFDLKQRVYAKNRLIVTLPERGESCYGLGEIIGEAIACLPDVAKLLKRILKTEERISSPWLDLYASEIKRLLALMPMEEETK